MDMGKGSAVKEALKAVLGAISEADGREMMGRRGPPKAMSIEVEAEPAECPECEAGTCTKPEHMSEEDMAGMMGD